MNTNNTIDPYEIIERQVAYLEACECLSPTDLHNVASATLASLGDAPEYANYRDRLVAVTKRAPMR